MQCSVEGLEFAPNLVSVSITRCTVFALLQFVTWGIGPLQLVIDVVQNRQARDALGEDKQKAHISFKIIIPFVYFHPCASMVVFYHVNELLPSTGKGPIL